MYAIHVYSEGNFYLLYVDELVRRDVWTCYIALKLLALETRGDMTFWTSRFILDLINDEFATDGCSAVYGFEGIYDFLFRFA